MGSRRSSGRASRPNRGSGLQFWPPPEGVGLALAGLGLIFLGHLAYGLLRIEANLIAIAASALLLLACVALPQIRRDLLRIRGLGLPAILFALTLAMGALSLTPYALGGPHPAWDYVGLGPGSASLDRSATILELVKLLGLGCIFLVGAATGASDNRAKTAVNLLLLLAAAFGLWAFISFATGVQFQTQRGRLEATLMSPNTVGTFFAAMVVIALGPLMRDLRGVSPGRALQAATGYWAALLILSVCLLATASRGAALGAGAGILGLVLLLVFAGRVAWSRVSLITLGAMLATVAAIYIFGENLINRFTFVEESAIGRGELFAMHWRAFMASPLSGYGLGSFDTIHRTLLDTTSVEGLWRIRATHNVYLQWLEEAGLAGALPMFACLGAIMAISLLRGMRRSRMTYVLFALIAANLVFLVHGMSDFALQTPSMALMWSYLLGLQFAVSQGSQR
ncbi:O-antigen ligase [Phenylobacterium sp.]|uniref:O-antigen ligase family protein n=1 Tax=Phenylobacterium sp. TaxID=1871053 RepID=UPI0027315ED2|nr:O-antigen ligase family protein [Phenylobacterium sp.]MDP2213482.1 O-antigen ligase family protein [Phenylobacterium sp.]